MTVEFDIFDALKGLVGNRVYPDVGPADVLKPYATYQQVGGIPLNFVENAVPSKSHGRFQVNVWSTSRAECASLSRQAAAALITGLLAEKMSEPIAMYEEDTKLYGSMQDFGIWYDN